ncbi:MAG: hypothetical protein QOI31_1813 [Solirubrobacterales bacterium]|jgi:hypothetical protein|nr:hypothetical protein [Solirubrobacterales bacterium]
MGRTMRTCVVALGAFGIAAAFAMAAPPNGNFESGSFDGWKTVDEEGGGSPRSNSKGKWQVYKNQLKYGESPPPRRGIGGGPNAKLAEPPQGTYAAGLASQGPGTHILYRKITVSGGQELSLQLAYFNTAGEFFVQNDLDSDTGANQQLRVDIMEPDAPIDSLEPADIVENVFRTNEGDDSKRNYFKRKTDLDAGEYRLRIAEVDNQAEFLVGVDAVKLTGN